MSSVYEEVDKVKGKGKKPVSPRQEAYDAASAIVKAAGNGSEAHGTHVSPWTAPRILRADREALGMALETK